MDYIVLANKNRLKRNESVIKTKRIGDSIETNRRFNQNESAIQSKRIGDSIKTNRRFN